MNNFNHIVLRSALAIVLGFVLVLWPEVAITYLVITIGILFILPGVFSILSYFTRGRGEGEPVPMFPVEGAGSLLFGVWLVVMPEFFVNILMYILGALLVIAGIQQIVVLIRARKWASVSWMFFVIPVLLFLSGIFILAYPFRTAATTFIVFGVASIVYGLAELINGYRFRRKKDIIIDE